MNQYARFKLPNPFVDFLLIEFDAKNDSKLADMFGCSKAVISRARSFNEISADLLLAIHEADPEAYPIAKLKAMIGPRLYRNKRPLKKAA